MSEGGQILEVTAEIVILAKGGSLHHARPLLEHFGKRALIESDWVPDSVMRHQPSLVITFDEHGAELALCIAELARGNVATLQIMDGILEWRRTWDYPTSTEKRPINQPVLAHKVACLGRTDARIMESWGNIGKCETVGSPRFDKLVANRKPIRTTSISGRPLRLLIMTAKTPGFTPKQVDTTVKSLQDLNFHLEQQKNIEVIWRVTQNLHERLGVKNTVRNILSTELHDMLSAVDAVITTPSTAMLESMLAGHPVALLDYHNCPHYVPAAWRITAESQIAQVLKELHEAPLDRMLYQDFCLHESLSCRTPALPRMINLIETMIRARHECKISRKPLVLPHCIVADPDDHVSWPSVAFDLGRLYPHHPVFANKNMVVLQSELEAALGTIRILKKRVDVLSGRLNSIPGYRLATRIVKSLKGKG